MVKTARVLDCSAVSTVSSGCFDSLNNLTTTSSSVVVKGNLGNHAITGSRLSTNLVTSIRIDVITVRYCFVFDNDECWHVMNLLSSSYHLSSVCDNFDYLTSFTLACLLHVSYQGTIADANLYHYGAL